MDCPNPMKSTAATAATTGLPDDALVEILSHLPVKPLHRSKCVARSWCDLICDPLLQTKLAQTLEGFFVIDDSDDWGHLGFVNLLSRSVPLDIDPCFSFLTNLPGIETLIFLDSCNGLLLFEHFHKPKPCGVLGYIVCNPATKEWGTVPTCNFPPPMLDYDWRTYLVFDPTVSPHFHLVKFRPKELSPIVVTPHAYSSETGTWSHIQIDWIVQQEPGQLEVRMTLSRINTVQEPRRTFVNGMLHLIVLYPVNVVVVDLQGKTGRIISVPKVEGWDPGYLAQSQGCLHYLKESEQCDTLSIWVLKDYGTQEWVLLDTLNLLELFGKKSRSRGKMELRFIAIHPDRNVVFLAQISERKLIAYNMDRKEVSVIGTLGNLNSQTHIVPYVPYFLKSLAFKSMH